MANISPQVCSTAKLNQLAVCASSPDDVLRKLSSHTLEISEIKLTVLKEVQLLITSHSFESGVPLQGRVSPDAGMRSIGLETFQRLLSFDKLKL